MSDKIRFGIIGAGAVSDYHHVPGINIDPRAELVAICDPDEELMRRRQSDWGPMRCSADYHEIAADPDVESRLLCALAGLLSLHSEERRALLDRGATLQGNLIAKASMKLLDAM